MGPLPSRFDVSPSPDDPKVLDIDGDEAEAAFDALGSETARLILAAVYREPPRHRRSARPSGPRCRTSTTTSTGLRTPA